MLNMQLMCQFEGLKNDDSGRAPVWRVPNVVNLVSMSVTGFEPFWSNQNYLGLN